MLAALGWALFAAVQPLGIIAYIALLGSRDPRRNTRGFIIGWLLCAGLVAVLTVQLEGHTHGGGASQLVSSAGLLQIVVGVAALGLLVVRRRRGRAASKDHDGASERGAVGPFGAALIAALLQGWPVVAAAVAAAVKATDPGVGRVLAILLVIVVTTSTYLVAYVLAGLNPERTAARLDRLKVWIETHRDTVIDLVLVAVGLWLVVHGLVVQLTG
jgi:Sap, sulfolipid-1-addressing protein